MSGGSVAGIIRGQKSDAAADAQDDAAPEQDADLEVVAGPNPIEQRLLNGELGCRFIQLTWIDADMSVAALALQFGVRLSGLFIVEPVRVLIVVVRPLDQIMQSRAGL